MLIFSIKKFFAHWFAPVPLVLMLLAIAVLLLWSSSRRRQVIGKIAATFSLILLAVFSAPKIPDRLIEPFETVYPSYLGDANNIEYVVVLGCGHRSSDQRPITSELFHCSLARLMEGLRVLRFHPGSTLILSGYGGSDPFSNAEMMKRMVEAIGLSDVKIMVESNPRDTAEEAKLIKPYLISSNFLLVTSASHMPRSMNFFATQGLNPIAAPTNHLSEDYTYANWWDYAPDAGQLIKSERALYEIMGSVWQHVSSEGKP